MNQSQSTQKLLILFFLVFGLAYSQECSPLNPELYGDCTVPLGYVWTGSNCVLVYGCETGEDEEYFFDTYEECDIVCIESYSLGDLNNDNMLNVIDIVLLVNIILDSTSYIQEGDLNFDDIINVVDIVALINIIIADENETRDTWQIINEDIFTCN